MLKRVAEGALALKPPQHPACWAAQGVSLGETPLYIKMELGSNEAIKQAVIGGLGLGLLSQSTLSPEVNQKELKILDVVGFPIMRARYVVRPKGK